MVNIETFARALDRAIQDGCRIRPSELSPGLFDVRSGSSAHVWYMDVSIDECGCKAGKGGTFCKHRALVAYVTKQVDEVIGRRVPYDREGAEETYQEVLVA